MYNNELYHYGIKGQKWGVRRYQNKDGSLTPAGKKHYDKLDEQYFKKYGPKGYDLSSKRNRELAGKEIDEYHRAWKEYFDIQKTKGSDSKDAKLAYEKFKRANADMYTKLVSDIELPSGRTIQYIAERLGTNERLYEFVDRY